MKMVISITGADYERLKNHLLQGGNDEEAAILLAGMAQTNRQLTLLVREVIPVPEDAFLVKGQAYLSIHPDFLAPLIKQCRLERWSFLLCHSHPFSTGGVRFSWIDDAGEVALFPKIQGRALGLPHGAIVFGMASVDARVWLPGERWSRPVDLVKVVGDPLLRLVPTGAARENRPEVGERHHRQVLAFGEAGQAILAELRVGVIGAGGIGSLVYEQLVRLGVGEVTLMDPQDVEESNISRIVGSTAADVGRPKVEVLRAYGLQINPALQGEPLKGSITDPTVVVTLRDADLLFSCTDNLVSRLILNRMAEQYLIPVIDTGTEIQPVDGQPGEVRTIGGRVMVILPDGPCLGCLGVLTPEALRREAEQQRVRSSYVQGQEIPAPAVISLNGVIASLAVTEFLNLVLGFAKRPERVYQRYDGIRGVVKAYALVSEQACNLCGKAKAVGDKELILSAEST